MAVTGVRRLVLTVLCLFVPLAAGAGGCASDASIIQQANTAHGQIEPAVFEDPTLSQYVEAIGDRIVAAAREEYSAGLLEDRVKAEDPEWMFTDVKFHLVNSDTLNAFTTGGPHVYLYSKLFETAKTEDEFAAVVAHEFAHIYGRHVHKGMERQYGMMGAALGAGLLGYALGGDNREQVAQLLAGGALVGGQFWGVGRTRNDEAEADELGFVFYTRAGYDPARFGDFFRTMIELGYETPEEQAQLADHPRLTDRVNAADARARALGPEARRLRREGIASPREFEQLKARSVAVGERMPNDESLEAAQLMLASFRSCVAPKLQDSQVEARQRVEQVASEAVARPASDEQPQQDRPRKKKKKRQA